MKKITSLLALFLICFGITASAQTIESIGQNITDPKTQLIEGSYVIFKNVSSGKFLYVDEADKNGVKLGTEAKVGAGAEYLWQVHVSKDQYFFTCKNGNYFPRPKTIKETKNGINCAGPNAGYKGLFDIVQHTTTSYWSLNCKWTEGKTKKHNKYWSVEGDLFAGIDVASKDEAITQYEIIPVTPAKSDDQKAVEDIVTAWTGLEKYAGGIADLKPINDCKTKAEAEAAVKAAVKNPIDDTEYFQILNVKSGKALNVVNGELSSVEASIFDANQLWKLSKNAEGKYTLLHANYNQFVQAPGTNALAASEVILDVTDMDLAQWSLSTAGTDFLALNADATVGVATAATAEGAQWYLVPKKDLKVALTPVYAEDGTTVIDAWGSICLPFDATCGNPAAPFELYGVRAAGNAVATLQKLTDLKTLGVKAGKGLILHAVAKKDGTFQLDYGFKIGKNAKNASEDQSWNLLKGTNVAKETAGNGKIYYVLGLNNGEAGLFGSNSTVLKANRAYLEILPEEAPVNGFRLDFGEVTGIEGVVAPVEEVNAVYYDLSGRRVLTPSNGVYIKNGKKVYVK